MFIGSGAFERWHELETFLPGDHRKAGSDGPEEWARAAESQGVISLRRRDDL